MVSYIKGTMQGECFQAAAPGEYLGPSGNRMGNKEGFTIRNFIECII